MMAAPKNKYPLPGSSKPFRFSRAATGLLLATVVLGVILTFSTFQNINRAQLLMEKFLLEKGETIIHSIEAGGRAAMMHFLGNGAPLDALLHEYIKDNEIAFIIIVDNDGSAIEYVSSPEKLEICRNDIEQTFTSVLPVTRINTAAGLFIYTKKFSVDIPAREMQMHTRKFDTSLSSSVKNQIISIGLPTEEFDAARRQDDRHTLFMGSILFLIGSAGLYFLFLYQKVRMTGSHLADMKLYTDSIIESIPVGLVTLDAKDHIVACNKNTEELFGKPISILQGGDIHETFPQWHTSTSLTCDMLLDYEFEYPKNDGRVLPLRISCAPLVNYNGENIGKVLIIRDMSLIKNMEFQLERSRRMAALGKMAAGIAHEIRNPLGTLRGFAQFFGLQSGENSAHREYSDLMISEIDRLNKTVSELLQFARPRDPQFQQVNLDELFKKTVSLMDADLAGNGVEIELQSNSGIAFRADPDLLLQVLLNLLKNSIHATPAGGKISLSGSENERFTKISVVDNGSGMSKENREKMFDPFFTTSKTGTGLGLAVSHQIIEQHFGRFEVVTEPGEGTSVILHIPKEI